MRGITRFGRMGAGSVALLALIGLVAPSEALAAGPGAAPALSAAADADIVSILMSVFGLIGHILGFVGDILGFVAAIVGAVL